MPKIKKCKASFINSIPFLVIGISRTDYRQMFKEHLPINWTCSDCQQPNNEDSMHVEEENANTSSDTVHASQGRIQGGTLPKIEKNMIFWHKIVIFHTKYPKIFRTSLRSAQFF
jgi:hypothetical protein